MRAKIFVDQELAGHLEKLDKGYRFTYLSNYQGQSVSLTMPVTKSYYDYETFPPFFDGLLPEGIMLEALLKQGKLDRSDLFGQLITVGGDLVGNVTVEAEK
ncbi:toxin HipA [Candidatus Aerophobetes bacterium]|uniref:Toxin HipA n=1 Tax=Aerophobetes bacterium TaxID=2030807 RepID=A0A2A4YN92_UNCAE|nr:MAG: toxin HipA [Candidatus Aerophobetes bacterium]